MLLRKRKLCPKKLCHSKGSPHKLGSKLGAKHNRTRHYRSAKDTGKSLTMQRYCLSAEISGLQVRVLPGSPFFSNIYAYSFFLPIARCSGN